MTFILLSNKKNDRIKKQSSESMLGTPLPEDAEVPFISSLQGTKARSMSLHNKSSALESFMKFDKKYTRVSSFESNVHILVPSLKIRIARDYMFCIIVVLPHFSKDAIQNRKKMISLKLKMKNLCCLPKTLILILSLTTLLRLYLRWKRRSLLLLLEKVYLKWNETLYEYHDIE